MFAVRSCSPPVEIVISSAIALPGKSWINWSLLLKIIRSSFVFSTLIFKFLLPYPRITLFRKLLSRVRRIHTADIRRFIIRESGEIVFLFSVISKYVITCCIVEERPSHCSLGNPLIDLFNLLLCALIHRNLTSIQ